MYICLQFVNEVRTIYRFILEKSKHGIQFVPGCLFNFMTRKTFNGETNQSELEVNLFDDYIEISISDDDSTSFVHLTKSDIYELIDELNIFLSIAPLGGKHE